MRVDDGAGPARRVRLRRAAESPERGAIGSLESGRENACHNSWGRNVYTSHIQLCLLGRGPTSPNGFRRTDLGDSAAAVAGMWPSRELGQGCFEDVNP